jgi:hypothetical protein
MYVSSVVSANKPHEYIHTVELDVKIVKVNQNNKSIVYEYQGKIIESKYTINGYYDNDNSTKNLNEMKVNDDYVIMLSFPVDKRKTSLQNLDKGVIIFIGRGVHPV